MLHTHTHTPLGGVLSQPRSLAYTPYNLTKFSLFLVISATVVFAGCESPNLNNPHPELASSSSTTTSVWNLSLPFPGAGTYSGVSSVPPATQLCAGMSLVGVSGTAICLDAATATSNAALPPLLISSTVLYDSAGKRVTGTMPLGANVSGANGSLSMTIPLGYYDGTKLATTSDTNLVAANIKSGTPIFGVTGTAILAYGACTDNVLNAGQCSTAVNRYVASLLGSAVSGVNGSLSKTIPQGFYDGTTSCSMSDTNLIAANIKSSVNIFGVVGTAVVEIGTTVNGAVAADMISGKEAWDNMGTKLTGTMSSNGNLNVANAWLGAGYYGASPTNAPTATQLCTGTSVLGVAGSAICGGVGLNSNAYRDMATTPITQTAETTTYAGAALPAGYRDVPVISKDDDGYVNVGVTSPQITLSIRPGTNCGTTQNTIAARLTDCTTQNGANATWDGTLKANTGQGVWKLVTRAAANKEVWQDQRTGLLWSSVLSVGDNWCRASGNAEAGDPFSYCNSVTYQPSYPTAQSWCAESGPTAMATAAGSGEVWASGTYNSAKGGMGQTSTASSPSVRWRLPTIYDYEQANINGIRFVMPEMVTTGSGYEWSASVYAVNRFSAWMFFGAVGSVNTSLRFSSVSVRCVGR